MITRIFARITLLFITILVIALLSFGYLSRSQKGLTFTINELSQLAKKKNITLLITEPKGTLRHFHAEKILLKTPTIQLKANDIEFKWTPLDLIKWELNINKVSAKTLNIHLYQSHLTHKKETLLPIPRMSISEIATHYFQVTFPDHKTLFGKIHSSFHHHKSILDQVDISYQSLHLSLIKPVRIFHHNHSNSWKNLCFQDNEHNTICSNGRFTNTQNWHINVTPHIQHLNVLDTFLSTITQTDGMLTGTLNASSDPKSQTVHLSGKLHLSKGTTLIPILGMHPTHIEATLTPQKNHLMLFGTADIGKAKLTITGSLQSNQIHPKLSITFTGNHLNAIRIPAAHIYLSPVLTYTFHQGVQSVTGNVFIPNATIDGNKIHQSASSTTDIVYVSPNGKIMKTPGLKLLTHVTVTLGKNVNFSGFGIHTKLKGTLLVTSKVGTPLLGNGIWHLYDGRYTNHGKVFTLNRSSILFNDSPLSNPTLNVTAEYNLPPGTHTSVDNQHIILGVTVGGSISMPKLNFFSTPAMSENDILSYIIFGVPATKANTSQQSEISQAALSYALSQGNVNGLSQIKKKLGIDSIGVGTINDDSANEIMSQSTASNPQNDTAVFVGKQLTKRLYVSYGVGLFNQEQEFKTQFVINPYLELRTNSSSESNGADLVFTYHKMSSE